MRIVLFLLASVLSAQNYVLERCSTPNPSATYLWATAPAPAQSRPVCLTLGPGLMVKTINNQQTLVTATEASQVFQLDPATPAGTLTLLYGLSKTPAPGTLIKIIFTSSQAGSSRFIITPVPVTNSRIIELTLPQYRPFTSVDSFTVLYSTFE